MGCEPKMDNVEIDKYAKIIWDYHHLDHKLEKADCIIVLGSHDVRVALRGAQLFLDGFAPRIIFSGGKGRLTEEWDAPEADIFAQAAIKMGVPQEKILIENRATNTGENLVLINIMVGDMQRIIEYPKKGFQIHQDVPEKVMAAYKALVKTGYTKQLIKEQI